MNTKQLGQEAPDGAVVEAKKAYGGLLGLRTQYNRQAVECAFEDAEAAMDFLVDLMGVMADFYGEEVLTDRLYDNIDSVVLTDSEVGAQHKVLHIRNTKGTVLLKDVEQAVKFAIALVSGVRKVTEAKVVVREDNTIVAVRENGERVVMNPIELLMLMSGSQRTELDGDGDICLYTDDRFYYWSPGAILEALDKQE